ncbi:1,4-dihydroxy-2-naphthoate polyprenyltransferase [Fulvivirgaceae bacterium PWU20]|uniref:1,4-dihydroxy-2-naphthoate octaprenyltransferase n=1 Tax=Chryseosolibacter indicus TaxID=2782351 RepID=A0ABS5VZT4_9BACT|nr:1,4-dihydroxy-2-naphthoate polyprenyltransferase [Chryseosolibacter indicus]
MKIWLKAARLRTLPLALSCIFMGAFLALSVGAFQWDIFLLCVLTTIFLQVLSNLANDYGDSIHGADNVERVGPSRVVQSGHISASQMRSAVLLFVFLSLISGLLLLFVSFGSNWRGIISFLGLGLLSIVAAIAYTVGKKPYGYIGLGDISVLIFFGFVGVGGSYFLFVKNITLLQLLPALSCGLFSIAVLNINNIRDIESDKKAGKYSIPVRIGKEKAVVYHWLLLFFGLTASIIYTIITFQSAWQLLFLLSVPLFVRNGVAVTKVSSKQLDPFLKQMAISTLLFVLLFGGGIALAFS